MGGCVHVCRHVCRCVSAYVYRRFVHIFADMLLTAMMSVSNTPSDSPNFEQKRTHLCVWPEPVPLSGHSLRCSSRAAHRILFYDETLREPENPDTLTQIQR